MTVRAVLVDDEPDVRELLRLRFERHGGFEVVGEGDDGPDAVALCDEHQPDVLILDELLPSGKGTDVVRAVLAASPGTVVIIYTGQSGTGTRDVAERVGARAVVGKLDPFDRLVGTIFRLLPDKAPPAPGPVKDDFGERMTALLAEEGRSASGWSWWHSLVRSRTRIAWVLLLVLVVLPMAAAMVWVVSELVGGSITG